MTTTFPALRTATQPSDRTRFTLHRAGILNVWQYDEQEFTFADGRLLLRGANGAGKSKTLEMLLPFVLDGDKARLTASAKHHTSLLWLMTDGYQGQARVGYVWVEFARVVDGTVAEVFTCGVGIRASASARTATAWHFATSRRIGHDLLLEDAAGPLSRARLAEEVGDDGQVFDKASAYKEHVGRRLFGLDPAPYDEVLRLLYWLRQPQVGEDIEPTRLAQQLSQALPALDEQAVRSAGDTFDELTAFGEQIQRRAAAADALNVLAQAYQAYAGAAVAQRARTLGAALREERRLTSVVKAARTAADRIESELAAAQSQRDEATAGIREADARLSTLRASPEYRSQQRLSDLTRGAARDREIATAASTTRARHEADTQRRADILSSRREQAAANLHQHTDALRSLDRRLRQTVPGSGAPVPAVLESLHLDDVTQAQAITGALDHSKNQLHKARTATSARTAGIGLVLEAVQDMATALASQRTAEDAADQAEARWERARHARVVAQDWVEQASAAFGVALHEWATACEAPAVELPDELSEDTIRDLSRLAADAARPRLTSLHADLAAADARRETAAAEQERLTRERAEVAAQRDPAPPAPVLARTPRTDALALWQVIDFAEGVDESDRAGLEAALQSAGLLDALVRPGGRLLDQDQHDVVLSPAAEAPRRALAESIVPDLPPQVDVSTDDVARVLAAIGTGAEPDGAAWVAPDGRWRLGPAHGRATKSKAQYIGATARAQERGRRLALIDEALAEQRVIREAAEQAQRELSTLIGALEQWQARVPQGGDLIRAWAVAEERLQEQEREEQENRAAQAAAQASRTHTATTRAALDRLAAEQELPTDRPGLAALEQELRSLDEALRDSLQRDLSMREHLERWLEADEDLAHARAALAHAHEAEGVARDAARESAATVDALRSSLGDSIQELQERIAAQEAARSTWERAQKAAEQQVQTLTRESGKAQAAASNAEDRLTEHLSTRADAIAGLVAVIGVPGMVEASGMNQDDAALIAGLADMPTSEPMPRPVAAAASRLAERSDEDPAALDTRVWKAHNEASSGPAADHQTSVSKFGDLLTVTGRDDVTESAIVILARRVQAAVDLDRDLLTEREKQQFEQHILGELGDAIRQRRRDAEELVTAMNEQLGKVTTTQGIRVRLDWRLREDVPAEARTAVKLLTQPVGALIPEERASLRDALHRLIEASRAERPENTYGEHLAAALDYRMWSEFTIRYTRPERSGHWDRLHRRSPLSQGEQKVLCYLPLFAAAAAHFTAMAGAAPHAPRLVLLDDAFPKIDVRTHPLLFGLLVQLDLDFVITSERLWGDHDTVPSLAIYEALRDPTERGIAQYRYEWDGRTLHSLG